MNIDTPFESSVYDELTSRGLKLIPSVGQSGYRIDFGVISDEDPNCFIAGIECDGTNYYAASTARDRDRLRQKVLEDLGWTIIRIWSIDWWRDKESQIDKVFKLISQAQNKVHQIPNEIAITDLNKQNFDPVIQEATAPRKAFGNLQTSIKSEPNETELPSVPPYKLTLLSNFGTAEQFTEVPIDQIIEIFQRIITREAPIHLNDISKRIASFWEITRLNKQVKEKIDQATAELVSRNRLTLKNEFVWTVPEPTNIVRNRQGLDYVFDPDQICNEEYEQAVILILLSYGTRTRDKITQDVARLLGFNRAGQKIALRVADILQRLINNHKINAAATGLALNLSESNIEIPINTPINTNESEISMSNSIEIIQ